MCLACASLGAPEAHAVFATSVSAEVPWRSVAPTGIRVIDSLLWGTGWDTTTLDFTFPADASAYGAVFDDDPFIDLTGFESFEAELRDAARLLLTGEGTEAAPGWRPLAVADFTRLDFAETDAPSATLRLGWTTLDRLRGIVGDFPGPAPRAGDVFLDPEELDRATFPGTLTFRVLAHEIGHALGLKHPFSASAAAPGFQALGAALDYNAYTVMSFLAAPRAEIGELPEPGGHVQSWMVLDILALQRLYGADWDFRAGDTRYRWDAATGEMAVDGLGQGVPAGRAAAKVYATLWDGGGRDTYDFSNHAGGVLADLGPGRWSAFSRALLVELNPGEFGVEPPIFAPGNIANAMLPDGDRRALIEDAIGGAGADTLIGNVARNRLEGGDGADLVEGGAAADTLVGGAGADTLTGGAGFDLAVFNGGAVALNLNDRALDRGDAVGDAFDGIEGFILTGGNDSFAGTAVAELVRGGEGADTFAGGGGLDTLIGGPGRDHLRYQEPFGPASAALALDLEDATLNGGGAAGSIVRGIEHLVLTSGADSLFGTRAAEFAAGGSGRDLLDGRDGADTLNGGSGGDTLRGGLGADELAGGFDADRFVYGAPEEGRDLILDFAGIVDGGTDRIVLLRDGFDPTLGPGRLPGARFIEGFDPEATGTVGVLLYDSFDSTLDWDADGAGPTAAVRLARFEFISGLAAEDIFILA